MGPSEVSQRLGSKSDTKKIQSDIFADLCPNFTEGGKCEIWPPLSTHTFESLQFRNGTTSYIRNLKYYWD